MLEVDLTPADLKIDVLEGEPSSIVFPITIDGVAIDVATQFPRLVSRTRLSDGSVLEAAVLYQNTNEVVATIPALVYMRGQKVYWEMRDLDANKTWIVARVVVQQDRV